MKHYLGHEPYDRITNSLWSEIEYLINGIFGIKSGFTAGYFYYTFDNKYPVGFEYSAIAGLSLNFSKVNIKYNFEFSEKQLLYKTLKNSITLNIIF